MEYSGWIGSGLILGILLVRGIFVRIIPKRIVVLLWTAAALILLLPVTFSSPLSFYQLLPAPVESDIASISVNPLPLPSSALWSTLRRGVSAFLGIVMFSLWVIGLIRLHRGQQDRSHTVRTWLICNPMIRPLRVRRGRVSAPVCGGILFPVIVLPEAFDSIDTQQLECVLTHEYIHLCCFDPLVKLLCGACLCLHWFNPLAWLLWILARLDIEYACDEAVLSVGIDPKQYEISLLRAELTRNTAPLFSAGFGAGRTLRRAERIRVHRSRRNTVWIGAVLLSAVLLLGLGAEPSASGRFSFRMRIPSSDASLQEGYETSVRAPLQPPPPQDITVLLRCWSQFDRWNSAVIQAEDPYHNYHETACMEDVSLYEIPTVLSQIRSETGANLLRVIETNAYHYTVSGYQTDH